MSGTPTGQQKGQTKPGFPFLPGLSVVVAVIVAFLVDFFGAGKPEGNDGGGNASHEDGRPVGDSSLGPVMAMGTVLTPPPVSPPDAVPTEPIEGFPDWLFEPSAVPDAPVEVPTVPPEVVTVLPEAGEAAGTAAEGAAGAEAAGAAGAAGAGAALIWLIPVATAAVILATPSTAGETDADLIEEDLKRCPDIKQIVLADVSILRRELEAGNPQALEWLVSAIQQLRDKLAEQPVYGTSRGLLFNLTKDLVEKKLKELEQLLQETKQYFVQYGPPAHPPGTSPMVIPPYDPAAPSPFWTQFLTALGSGQVDLALFLAQVLVAQGASSEAGSTMTPAKKALLKLLQSETTGGHALLKHGPDVSDQDLKNRAMDPNEPSTATKFHTLEQMCEAVSLVLSKMETDIDTWAKSDPAATGRTLTLYLDTGKDLGRGYQESAGGPQEITGLTVVRLVVVRDGNGGWYILTAFPQK